MANQHPEEDRAQVVHVLDVLLRLAALAVAWRRLAQHGVDRLQHLAMVHDQPAMLDGQLHHVADLAQGEGLQERQFALGELTSHAIATSGKGVLSVEELRELLPNLLVVGIVRGVDVHPALEPLGLLHHEDRGLIRLRAGRRLLHDEQVSVLGVEVHEALHDGLGDRTLLQATLHVVGHRLDTILVQGLQDGHQHLPHALFPHALEHRRQLLIRRRLRAAAAAATLHRLRL
mmetsp:Transcript_87299/g.252102  ORF Transcript_87299/g.252102 Transcript_87299/m.252102 type:complete len:231 (-) Transcript_87299:718-1410(-)